MSRNNTIMPTVGREVLVTLRNRDGNLITLPMKVTHVHSQQCISGVAFSGLQDDGFHAGGTLPLASIEYDEADTERTWAWMEVQKAGGGFDARISAIEKAITALSGKGETAALTKRITKPATTTKVKAKAKRKR